MLEYNTKQYHTIQHNRQNTIQYTFEFQASCAMECVKSKSRWYTICIMYNVLFSQSELVFNDLQRVGRWECRSWVETTLPFVGIDFNSIQFWVAGIWHANQGWICSKCIMEGQVLVIQTTLAEPQFFQRAAALDVLLEQSFYMGAGTYKTCRNPVGHYRSNIWIIWELYQSM